MLGGVLQRDWVAGNGSWIVERGCMSVYIVCAGKNNRVIKGEPLGPWIPPSFPRRCRFSIQRLTTQQELLLNQDS